MTDKPNESSASTSGKHPADSVTAGTGGPTGSPQSGGEPARSPFDSPTEQFTTPASGQAAGDAKPTEKLSRPGGTLPRTDEELGLDPEVPAYSQTQQTAPRTAAGSTVPAGENQRTYGFATIPPAPSTSVESGRLRRRADNRRGTLDLGLLLLRLVVGSTFLYHGLQKAAGWFHGPGFDGIKATMADGGWKHVDIAAPMLIAGELAGGALLILGLATPLAAGAVLAVVLDAWLWKQGMVPGYQYAGTANGVEIDSILAGAAATLILTGPGRLSFDRNRGWATRPGYGSVAALLAAIAAAVVTYILLHGGNPLTGIGPFS